MTAQKKKRKCCYNNNNTNNINKKKKNKNLQFTGGKLQFRHLAAMITFVFICFVMAGFAGVVVNSSVQFEDWG